MQMNDRFSSFLTVLSVPSVVLLFGLATPMDLKIGYNLAVVETLTQPL